MFNFPQDKFQSLVAPQFAKQVALEEQDDSGYDSAGDAEPVISDETVENWFAVKELYESFGLSPELAQADFSTWKSEPRVAQVVKFRGVAYREVLAVQMGKMVDSDALNSTLKQFKQQVKEFKTAYEPAVQRYNNLKRFIASVAPKGGDSLTKVEGAAFQPYISDNLNTWYQQYEDRIKLLKKINSAAGEGLIKRDELETKLTTISQSAKNEVSNFAALVTAAKNTVQRLEKYTELLYNMEDGGEAQQRVYFNFIKQFPGTDILAPVTNLVQQYEKLHQALEALFGFFETAQTSLLNKVTKKQSKEKAQPAAQAGPSAAEPSVVVDEGLDTAVAKAQEELKWALELNFDGAKKEFNVLVKFLQTLYPTSAAKLSRLGNIAFDAEVLKNLSDKPDFSDADTSAFKKIYRYFSSIVENLETISELVLEKFKKPTGDAQKDQERENARKKLRSMNARNGIENDPLGSNLGNLKEMLDRLDGAAEALAIA